MEILKMTREEQKYRATARHQLIDLNKDNTNFQLRFECRAIEPSSVFQICVTNQEELDTKDMADMPLKDVTDGEISGNILADTNEYQNYFLVLRADKECDVVVTIDLESIPYVEREPSETPSYSSTEPHSWMTSASRQYWKNMLVYACIALLLLATAAYIFSLGKYGMAEEISLAPPSVLDELNNL